MGKWARFGFCGDSSLIRGEGGSNFSFYSVQDSILDKSNEKLGPPLPPISMMGKWARFGFCGDSSLIRGEGGGLISLFILSKIVEFICYLKNPCLYPPFQTSREPGYV